MIAFLIHSSLTDRKFASARLGAVHNMGTLVFSLVVPAVRDIWLSFQNSQLLFMRFRTLHHPSPPYCSFAATFPARVVRVMTILFSTTAGRARMSPTFGIRWVLVS